MGDTLAIALSVIFTAFVLIALAIVAYFLRKQYRRSADLRATFIPHRRASGDDDSVDIMLFQPATTMGHYHHAQESYVCALFPHVVALLKACKTLTHQLLAATIQSSDEDGLVTGSLDSIIAASSPVADQADLLTQAMYPPIEEDDVTEAAVSIVKSIDHFVQVVKANTDSQRLPMLDTLCRNVIKEYTSLIKAIDVYRRRLEILDEERDV
eukprot:m.47956 g.47956  ORF g.47956 m.47956 type:complete len:211 (-) comp11004_c0_seq1:2917-3549(-)